MKIDNVSFLKLLISTGRHVPDGKVDGHIGKGFSFDCGCGSSHSVDDAFAIRNQDNGYYIYACPNNDKLLNMAESFGFFKLKGIKTVASFLSDNSDLDLVYSELFAFRQMTKYGISKLSDYYEQCPEAKAFYEMMYQNHERQDS
ncbi:hypothetical protein ACFL3I_06285 [Pseudomonadota bacterium]